MSFWVILDDSIALAELLGGAGAAALGATLAELVGYQAAARFRMRAEWLVSALGLPGQVLRDTVIVVAALWRRLARGEQPKTGTQEPGRHTVEPVGALSSLTAMVGENHDYRGEW